MGGLKEKVDEALAVDRASRNQQLRGDLGKLQEQVTHWGRSGTFKKSYAAEKAREEASKIAERYNQELRREAEAARERVKDAQLELERELAHNAGREKMRQDEKRFLAELASDNELSSKLAKFAQAQSRLEAVTVFAGWDEMVATFAEAKRRGLSTTETFAQAWREAGGITRVEVDQPGTVNDIERAQKIESLKPGTALIERPGTGGEEMPVPITDLVDLSPLDNLAD